MRMNWHIWSGVWRRPPMESGTGHLFPTVVVDVALNDWALPLAVHGGGPLLGRPGFTLTIGPVKIGWSKL